MAEPQSSTHPCARTGAPTSGVQHIRTRLTANFTVIANALAQRRGSAVTVGVATYVLSLPDGAPVSIAALCAHFTEGEILISRALRELETAGYLERRRERTSGGLIRTRTYAYDAPRQGRSAPGSAPAARAPRARTPASAPAPAPAPAPVQVQVQATRDIPDVRPSDPARSSGPATRPTPAPGVFAEPGPPAAVLVLASLRRHDPRLILSAREVAELAPHVAEWLARGVGTGELIGHLTAGLPERFRARPARVLAFRLAEPPLPVPALPPGRAVLPWQTCDGGCERAFRAAAPGRCRDCPTAAPAGALSDRLDTAC